MCVIGSPSQCSRLLEVWLGYPVLWLACRRHVAELHLGSAVELAMGGTKDPGVALFRRLRDQWRSLDINLKDLVLWDWEAASPRLQEIAKEVLDWAQKELAKNTFPRADYKELMELVVVSLGGEVKDFSFKLPGADSNARWMAKTIYVNKMRLLSKVFSMSVEEHRMVEQLSEFVILFYARYWFTTPLACSAAREDLDFINNLQEYRKINSKFFWVVIRSVYNHLWYLCPQLITLALFDKDLESSTKEEMAVALYSIDRAEIQTGKPAYPIIAPGARHNMASLIGPESWLLFDLFDMDGPQDWLLAPAASWHLSPCYRKLEGFAKNMVVVNDLAERGCHLATEFVNRVESEEQRQALFQVVEEFRGRVKDTTKSSLKLC